MSRLAHPGAVRLETRAAAVGGAAIGRRSRRARRRCASRCADRCRAPVELLTASCDSACAIRRGYYPRPMRRRLRSAAFPLHRHSIPQLAIDGALVAAAYYLSYRLRFDTGTPPRYERLFDATIVFVVVSALVVFTLFRLELKQWRYTSSRDYLGDLPGRRRQHARAGGLHRGHPPGDASRRARARSRSSAPTGVMALFFLLTLVLVGGARFVARDRLRAPGARVPRARRRAPRAHRRRRRGRAARRCARSCATRSSASSPVGFVDDDPLKRGIRVDGVKVLAPTDQLARILDEAEPDEITIAIPSAPGTLRARVVRAARQRGIPVRTLPTVFELLQAGSGQVVRQVREVQVEDILGPRARAHGARPRRRLPGRRGGA